MRRIGLLGLAILMASVAPASADDVRCAGGTDVHGDNRALVKRLAGPHGSATDLVAFRSAADATHVVTTLTVADLPPVTELRNREVQYSMGFRFAEGFFQIEAYSTGLGLEVASSADYGDAIEGEAFEGVTGTYDDATEQIVLSFPISSISGATAEDALTDVNLYTTEYNTDAAFLVGVRNDWADNGFIVPLADGCTDFSPIAPTQICSVALDEVGDASMGIRDLTALSFGVSENAFVADIALAPSEADIPDGAVLLSFYRGDDYYSLTAQRNDGSDDFLGWGPDGAFPVRGATDVAIGSIRLEVERDLLGIDDGDDIGTIELITASTRGLLGFTFYDYDDYLDGEPIEWTVSATCSTDAESGVGALIRDERGDAGLLLGSPPVPRNQDALDVDGVGAASDEATLRVSMHVADLDEAIPAGFDGEAWNVSWRANQDQRWVAQAQRFADGSMAFGYALVDDPSDTPSGIIFEGSATSGWIDDTTDSIVIDVPLEALDLGDATRLEALGATTSVIQSGNTVGANKIVDGTRVAPYALGTDRSV